MSFPTSVPADRTKPSSRISRLFGLITRPAVLGVAVALAGLVGIVSAVTPAFPRRIGLVEGLVDPEFVRVAAGTTALLGFVLMLVGRGIARRRHSAYVMALVLLAAMAVTHLVKGLDVEEAGLTVAVAVCLVRARHEFTVASPAGRTRRVARLAVAVIGADMAIGMLGFAFGDVTRSSIPVTPGRALLDVIDLLGGTGGSAHFHGVGHAVPVALTLLGFASAAVLLVVAFAPAPDPERDEPRARVAALANRADGDTFGPFALRGDKGYVFSSDGRAAVAYRYVAGVGLASGDPVGVPDAFPDAIERFVERCDAHGWRPAFMGVRGDRLALYTANDFRTLYFGDEAVVDVATFSLDRPTMRGVRQAFNRTHNHGITTEITCERNLTPPLRDELLAIAERSRNGAPERGFSMALDELLSGRDADCVITIARDASGIAFAFQRYVPCQAGAGLSLDAMRRDRVGPNGVNERLIVDTIEWGRARGIGEVSLNFAFCRALLDDDLQLSPSERAQAWFIRRLNPYFQIESLLRFNAKFAPRWVPRFLAYRSLGDLAPIGTAVASAEGFLPFDRSASRRASRRDTVAA